MRQTRVRELKKQAIKDAPKHIKEMILAKKQDAHYFLDDGWNTIICPYKNYIRNYRRLHS